MIALLMKPCLNHKTLQSNWASSISYQRKALINLANSLEGGHLYKAKIGKAIEYYTVELYLATK